MNIHDQQLINRAHRMVNHQEIDMLISQARTKEARDRLRMMSSYRYHQDELFADCI